MLDAQYWNNRYLTNDMRWDVGSPTPPITRYIDQLEDPDLRILIPGCGQAWEGEYAWESGFNNIFLLDYAQETKDRFLERVPDFPPDQFLVGNFFDLEGTFDIVLEQTFFCALDPNLRQEYISKMKNLLSPSGKIAGVLFDAPLNTDHPPFGGSTLTYLGLFQPHFSSIYIKSCYNSIEERMGREVFIKIEKG